ncbi:Nucleolar protein 5A [Pyrenophora tritici-repentis]|uniref:Nucleolar protein 58 n=2 Tax=Pyrenophora tritici-repentis TaxID=45151 RepID=A0A922NME6_9PLEO|nr:nucleolar protein 5A [Pyrenophora tritici-repentis Pt-1C-BFP]EDU45094.1 nucleolar protein 5A [Pyrenophora tritici-repentis Pt-1C-BFP]KAI1518571.1 Nucleolar protein 5A [Pyrenophora tritici-repentis]KAI1672136.1 Nucleolar protein 5A [Pyrenophora tritici-repentis]KAI1686146.1 Nucleolar protein 5A [Pyrenophora tritici-repentis]
MGLFILSETSAGYVLLKSKDKKLLGSDSKDASSVVEQLKVKKFAKFGSAVAALEQAAALHDGKVTPMLSSLLDELKDETKATLAVADPKLSNSIAQLPGLSLKTVSDSSTQDVFRAIRENLTSLLPDLLPAEEAATRLGLAHSLSRHKLRFSPDKVDTMIIQSIASLDVLDKQLNTYAMRVKEWYGWHFPELAKILNDNLAYSRVVLKMGFRTKARESDLSEILPEEIEAAVKAAAEISMGTEITDEDLEATSALAEQVVDLTEHRQSLGSYLSSRMQALAPNLTALVGELVGARLIAHAGSLMNLAKSPGSTIQILGAEKALFRALKTKHDTPKYGLIYHASLIGQATGKNKGKIARMLAAKSALGLRVDALSTWGVSSEDTSKEPSEEEKSQLGRDARLTIERRLRALEGKPLKSLANANQTALGGQKKWEVKEARKYNPDADGLTGDEPAADAPKESKKAKAPKKLVQEVDSDGDESMADADAGADESDSDSEEEKKTAKVDPKKAAKEAEKAAKKARKAEREAKREAKKAKKAAKESKKSDTKESKKRKADGGDDGEKKKKKKKSKD